METKPKNIILILKKPTLMQLSYYEKIYMYIVKCVSIYKLTYNKAYPFQDNEPYHPKTNTNLSMIVD